MDNRKTVLPEKTAIVLIDMQTMFLTDTKKSIIPNQTEILKFYSKQNIPLIIIESNGYGATHYLLEQEIVKFKKYLVRRFSKCENDGFSNQQLHKHLQQNSINNLLLTGINGCACVFDTALSARAHGYTIMTSKDLLHGFCSEACANARFKWYSEKGILQNSYKELLVT